MIRLCCPLFNKNKPNENQQRGVIINTASISAMDGVTGCLAYSTSKSAIVGMTLPLALDLAKMGVRVITIAPGLWEFLSLSFILLNGILQVTFSRRYIKMCHRIFSMRLPIQFNFQRGHPDEYAHMVQTIIENPMLNGEVIRLDGATSLLV